MPTTPLFTAFGQQILNSFTIEQPDRWHYNPIRFSDLSDKGQNTFATALTRDSSNLTLRQPDLKDKIRLILQYLDLSVGQWGWPTHARPDERHNPGFSNATFCHRWNEKQISSVLYALIFKKSGQTKTIEEIHRKMKWLDCQPKNFTLGPNPLLAQRLEEEKTIKN